MSMYSGAQIIVTLLQRQGVDIVAGIPGGATLPLYDALRESSIRHILARHEQGAGFMAQGLARFTGKPGVFLATSGPGATNTLTALADAKCDSVPLVCITGQVTLDLLGTDAFQEVDIYGMSLPVTKHNYLVRSAAELLRVIPDAFRVAASGRPGPVLIDIPKSVQMERIEVENWPEPGLADPAPQALTTQLHEAARLLNRAKRPLLYVGGGVRGPKAVEAVRLLARKAMMPVVSSLMGLAVLPWDDPLRLGMLGMHGARHTNMLLQECDALLVAGARLDDRATGPVSSFCPGAALVHVDIDLSEIDKLRPAAVGLSADVSDVLQALLPLIEDGNTRAERQTWLERVSACRREFPLELPEAENPCSSYGMIRWAARLAGPDALVCTDVGQHQMRVAQAYPFSHARQWFTSGGLGTMGFGLPTAIGAALADPDRTVLCFSGDGSLLMNIQEMATVVEHQARVKILLADNGALGLVCQQQELFFGGRYMASRFAHQPDFVQIAHGFGLNAVDLGRYRHNHDDAVNALAAALAAPGPWLIRVPVEASDNVYPMVVPGKDNLCVMDRPASSSSPSSSEGACHA